MAIRLIKSGLTAAGGYGYALMPTAWGHLAFICQGTRLCRLIMPRADQSVLVNQIIREYPLVERDDKLLPGLQRSLIDYFQGRMTIFDCQVDVSWASVFGWAVLQHCSRIKVGQTVSYGALARQVGRPGAARAVGAVMAQNRVPLVIPCHRVVKVDGSLGGYSAPEGIELKKRLLEHEAKSQEKSYDDSSATLGLY